MDIIRHRTIWIIINNTPCSISSNLSSQQFYSYLPRPTATSSDKESMVEVVVECSVNTRKVPFSSSIVLEEEFHHSATKYNIYLLSYHIETWFGRRLWGQERILRSEECLGRSEA